MRLKTAIILSACIGGVLVVIPIVMGNAIQAGENSITAAVMCLVILGFGTLGESNYTNDQSQDRPKLSKKSNIVIWILAIVGIIIIFFVVAAFIFGMAGSTSNSPVSSTTPVLTLRTTVCQVRCNGVCLKDTVEICSYDRLKNQGYNDCVDCMRNSGNAVCDNIDRYNAEVDAKNDCWNQTHPDTPLQFYYMKKVKMSH